MINRLNTKISLINLVIFQQLSCTVYQNRYALPPLMCSCSVSRVRGRSSIGGNHDHITILDRLYQSK